MEKLTKQQLKEAVYVSHLKYPDQAYSRFREIDVRFPKSGHTIKNYVEELKDTDRGNELKSQARVVNLKSTKKVMKFLDDDSLKTINILISLKDAIQYKADNAKDDPFMSMKDIAITYGILVEKEMAIKSLEIEEAKLEIKKQELTIKKSELDIRISNPEAFAPSVTIINDAKPHDIPDYHNDENYKYDDN